MSGHQQSAEDRTALLEPELSSDPELLQTLLSVFRDLDLSEQARTLLTRAEAWTGGQCGFALMAGDDPETWVPMITTLTRRDPRYRAVGRFDPTELRERIGDQAVVYPGLGPLDAALNRWPDPAPAATLCLPVRDTEGTWGGLLLLMLDSEPAPEQMRRLRRLFELSAPAVRHALQLRGMRELVIKDDTAQCYNRRYFEERLPEELARARRFRAALSLIFLDMDNLKRVNSKHGHSMGSRTLTEVSTRIRSKIRKFDKLFRFGGDEFCILLPETEWEGALEVAERVREAILSKPFVEECVSGGGIPMSASLGIAAFPLHARTQQELVQQADRAMQKIKLGTKNSIGVAEASGGRDGS